MLLKVILKSINVMITCKKSGPYLKISLRYWDLKILRWQDFVVPWATKIPVTCSIFGIPGSSFGFSPLLCALLVNYMRCLSKKDHDSCQRWSKIVKECFLR